MSAPFRTPCRLSEKSQRSMFAENSLTPVKSGGCTEYILVEIRHI